MGKGDKKSKKGKIALGSYGNSRRKNAIKGKVRRATAKKAAEVAGDGAEAPAKAKRAVKKKAEG